MAKIGNTLVSRSGQYFSNTKPNIFGISLYGLIFVLEEGERRQKILQLLIKKLKEIKDPENDKLIVEKIYLKDELYKGKNPEKIPDLIIKPIKGYSFTGLFNNKSELFNKINRKLDFAIGKHSENGILIINGLNVIKNKEIKDSNLTDIVPTILHYFGIPLSDKIEGNVLEIFK